MIPPQPRAHESIRVATAHLEAGATALPPSVLEEVEATEGWLAQREAALLYLLAKAAPASAAVVEVGSYRGRSTVALAAGVRDGARERGAESAAPVFAVEPHERFAGALGGQFGPADRGAFYETMLRTGAFEHVRLVNLSSEIVCEGWRRPVALLWIDGDHRYEGVSRDFACWRPHLAPGAVVVFDDATNGDLGPQRLVAELLAGGEFAELATVGKVVALRAASE